MFHEHCNRRWLKKKEKKKKLKTQNVERVLAIQTAPKCDHL